MRDEPGRLTPSDGLPTQSRTARAGWRYADIPICTGSIEDLQTSTTASPYTGYSYNAPRVYSEVIGLATLPR